jgi:hypothetical protein
MSEEELGQLTRDELNARAAQLGVENPDGLRTKADVIAAIRRAGGAGPSSRTAQQATGGRALTPRKARLLRQRRARGQL